MLDHDRLIEGLSVRAAPVRRVSPAWLRVMALAPLMLALGWLATTIFHRAVTGWSVPLPGIGIANAALSLLLGAAILNAALATSIPGGRLWGREWIGAALIAWVPVTIMAIGPANGLSEAYREGRYCFAFLIVAGVPMAAVVIAALRRTRSLTPARSLIAAGLSVGFFAFGLLAFCHPAATTLADTLGHLGAALVLGLLTTLIGSRLIAA